MKPFFDGPLPRVIAHRGFAPAGGTIVENTLPAFAAALELGATHLETDVHASSDGHAVISHDPDLSRLAGHSGQVSDFTLEQLTAIDLGGGVGFCSLEEALATFPEARFNIDIKSADAAAPTAAAVIATAAHDRVLVTSFSGSRRLAAVRLLPGVATSASAGAFAVALLANAIGLTPLMGFALRRVDAVQVPVKALGLRVPTERFIRRLHGYGIEMHNWTINDAETMRELVALGVDGIVSDRTDIAVASIVSTS